MNLRFHTQPFISAATHLFESLHIPLHLLGTLPIDWKELLGEHAETQAITCQRVQEVYAVGIVDELVLSQQATLFNDYEWVLQPNKQAFNEGQQKARYNSLLIMGVKYDTRTGKQPTRSDLAAFTRAFNRAYEGMPVVVLFQYGEYISLANCERLPYKKSYLQGEKTGKVSMLKNIYSPEPHSGHLRILNTLTERLSSKAIFTFDELYQHWQEVFNIELLNQLFYQDIFKWYNWAVQNVRFPDINHCSTVSRLPQQTADGTAMTGQHIIRFITRFIFTWFLKERKLIPDSLFDKELIAKLLVTDKDSSYYRAILQNLFFATLNTEIKARTFRNNRSFQGRNKHYFDHSLYRYQAYFCKDLSSIYPQLQADDDIFEKLFQHIPFLNGGLFDCLDRKVEGSEEIIRIDAFSDNAKVQASLSFPDKLFFNTAKDEHEGLLSLFQRYLFTIEENTPLDQEIALDPDLLGRMFENLLATINPETQEVARKQTGSFYTPREIVKYMCSESLQQYLLQAMITEKERLLNENKTNPPQSEDLFGKKKPQQLKLQTQFYTLSDAQKQSIAHNLSLLFQDTLNENPFSYEDSKLLVTALSKCKTLDPACGSGAYTMGMLDTMVALLQKLDNNNEIWKALQLDMAQQSYDNKIAEIEADIAAAKEIKNIKAKEAALKELALLKQEIQQNFAQQDADYNRKLYLINHCIYGVDLQPIAIEIAKLRCFLSLLVSFKTNTSLEDNFGIKPLPNLDFKLMQGNSLVHKYGTISLQMKKDDTRLDVEEDTRLSDHDLLQLKALMTSYFYPSKAHEKKAKYKEIQDIVFTYLEKRADAYLTSLQKELASNEWKMQQTELSTPASKAKQKEKEQANLFLTKERMLFLQALKTAQDDKAALLKSKFDNEKPYFLWDLFFADVLIEHNGFDLVLGNPPYVQLQKMGKQADLLAQQKFEVYERTGDIYTLFYEKGMDLLKQNGFLCYITSNKWMRAGYGAKLRDYFVEYHRPISLIDFGGVQVFKSATVDTNILMVQNANPSPSLRTCLIKKDYNLAVPLSEYVATHSQTSPLFATESSWVVMSELEQSIKSKVEKLGTPLKDWDIAINYGIKTGYNEAFIIDTPTKERIVAAEPHAANIIKPLLRGRDIKRYKADWQGLWLINAHNGVKGTKEIPRIDVPTDYPVVYKHLLQYEKALQKRQDKGEHWTNLRNCAYVQDFEKEKVIYPNMTKYLPFIYDDEGYYTNDKSFIIVGKHIAYLTAFFNSSLFKYCFRDNFPELQGGTRELRKIFFEPIPVKQVDDATNDAIQAQIKQIQALKKAEQDTSPLEAALDKEIAGLYELTEEEYGYVCKG